MRERFLVGGANMPRRYGCKTKRAGGTPALPFEPAPLVLRVNRPKDDSVQTRPIVGEQDGVAGIGGVEFDAGGLAGGYAAEVLGFFEAGDILRGFVSDAGNRVRVVEQLLRAVGKGGGGGAFLK